MFLVAFMLYGTDAKDKSSNHVIFCDTVVKSPQRKTTENLHINLIKMVDICRKIKSFFLFALCASDNVVHILLQLGTFHAHYMKHKN